MQLQEEDLPRLRTGPLLDAVRPPSGQGRGAQGAVQPFDKVGLAVHPCSYHSEVRRPDVSPLPDLLALDDSRRPAVLLQEPVAGVEPGAAALGGVVRDRGGGAWRGLK